MIWNGDCSNPWCEREALDARGLCRGHLGLSNPPWVAPFAIIGGLLVSCAIVLIFAAMWS